jgi:anti-anti-sigma regulatory factor
MPVNTAWLEVDGARLTPALQEALEKLDAAGGELILDFSGVQRVDPSALKAMENLAAAAGDKAVKVGLRGVNIGIYKAMKLAKLAPRFSFLT